MNDERPIEKLLRRYAQKRREEGGAPAKLHPANRRMLQEEVARQFPKTPRPAGWWEGWSWLLNRKLAYATAAVAAVVLVAVFLVPPKKSEFGLVASRKAAESELQSRSLDVVTADEPAAAAPSAASRESTANKALLETKLKREFADADGAKDLAKSSLELVKPDERADAELATATLNTAAAEATPSPTVAAAPPAQAIGGDANQIRSAARRQAVSESIARFNERNGGGAVSGTVNAPGNYAKENAPAPGIPMVATAGSAASNAGPSEVFMRRYGMAPSSRAVTPPSEAGLNATGVASPTAGTRSEVAAKGYYDEARAKDAYGLTVQNYSQVAPTGTAAYKGTQTSPVLTNFVVEQSGVQIRVTDSDGSTYTGMVQLVTEELKKEFIARGGGLEKSREIQRNYNSVAGGSGLGGAMNQQNLYFQVSGMNRTLKQPVNFFGNFVTLSNQVATVNDADRLADKNVLQQKQMPPAPVSALQNSEIQGRVQVGTGREMMMRALPAGK